LFVGCNSSENGSLPQSKKIEALEKSGKLPKLDRSSDIAGPDANGNGVRDDIEEYIVKNYTNEKERKAVMQDARAMQASLLVDVSDILAIKKVGLQMSRSVNCLFSIFNAEGDLKQNPHAISRQVEAITTNTKPRLKAYLAYNHALDGTTWLLPEGDTCE
jgi:hypothetical protein